MNRYSRRRTMYASVEGNGHRPPSEAYPFQGLSLPLDGYATPAAPRRSLDAKLGDATSPFGTPLAVVVRREVGMPAREGWDQAPDGWGFGESPADDGAAAPRRTRRSGAWT